jgi:hypothetical protein
MKEKRNLVMLGFQLDPELIFWVHQYEDARVGNIAWNSRALFGRGGNAECTNAAIFSPEPNSWRDGQWRNFMKI